MSNLHKKQIFLLLLILSSFAGFPQTHSFQKKFSKHFDYTIIPTANTNFKEYYEIIVEQQLDHSYFNTTFKQRIFVGVQNYNAPTVIVTDGYAIDYASKSDYTNELAKELKSNIVVVEHRFFGKSAPDTIDWNLLTMKQAADDCHFIKTILDKILTGKWISTGISKGGQAAIAYKMFYPNDVAAVVVYGTAIKSKQTVFTDTILSTLSQTDCGKKIASLQAFLLRNKINLTPYFTDYTAQKKYDFTPLDNETVLDYLLLELPFSFWQNGVGCENIPDTTSDPSSLVSYLVKVVPPRFFSTTNKKQLEPAFYMFYNQLGYYEYNIDPFIKYLKQKNYPNKYFAPKNTAITFDNTFQKAVITFMDSNNPENVFFIYGQNDPWALQTVTTKNTFIIAGGSHKSRIVDLPLKQQAEIFAKIRSCLK